MANENLTVEYNQLMWEMDRLRSEVEKANKDYISKLRDIRKDMQRTQDRLEWVSQRMSPRSMSDVRKPPVSTHDAGFLPTENTTSYSR